MTNPNEALLSLAARCETATVSDRVCEAAIFAVVHPGQFESAKEARHYAGCPAVNRADLIYFRDIGVPNYTASLDAAMTLAKGLEQFGGAGGMLREAMDRMSALPVMLSQMDPDEYRRTLARYFTAASLRALSHGERG